MRPTTAGLVRDLCGTSAGLLRHLPAAVARVMTPTPARSALNRDYWHFLLPIFLFCTDS